MLLKLGIVIPSYKSSFLERAVCSCMDCDYENTEVYVIIDDVNTEFSFQDDRVNVVHNKKNIGAAASRNIGVKKAFKNGCNVCLFLDSDDILIGRTVGERIDLMNKTKTKLIYSDYYNCDENGSISSVEKKPCFVSSELLKDNFISCLSMFDTKLYLQLGGMNENLTYCEDWLMWLKFSMFTIPIHFSKPCFKYCANRNSLTRNVDWNIYNMDKQIAIEDFNIFMKNGNTCKLKDLQNQKILYLRSKNVNE